MKASPMLMAPAGSKANNRFAFDLYARLAEASPGENLCFSPFSISAALSMLHAGARGETAREIAAVLRGDPSTKIEPARRQDAYGQPISDDTQPFRMANALWAHDGYPIRAEYASLLRERHGAEIRGVDFERDGEPTRRIINDWVSRKTNARIPMLLQHALDPSTRLILTNAVHFLARWRGAFDRALTKRQPFHLESGATTDVWMMHKQFYARYAEGDGFRSAAIEYENSARMWIVLPDEGRSLAEVEASLSADELTAAWSAADHGQEVYLWLPRFHVRARFELAPALAALGMQTVFGARADLSGMHEPHPDPLILSAVVHEAFTDVNEERTEAAAATAIVGRGGKGGSDPSQPVEFRCDRPFLFFIRDAMPGAILFMGRLNDPTKD
ncbi:MAG: serpin family protein [Tepidisphaeraceae bacterium]